MKKVIIVGGGPAGISCAIELFHYGIEPLIIERERVGGLLWKAGLIRNYPGFPLGIYGKELASLFASQLYKFNPQILQDNVEIIVNEGEQFLIETEKAKFYSDIVVIASGTRPKKLPESLLINSPKLIYDISTLEHCSNKRILIIGGGDIGFDYGLRLVEYNNEVIIVTHGAVVRCNNLLKREAELKGIHIVNNFKLVRILENIGSIIVVGYKKEIEMEVEIEVDFVLVAIGREPEIDFLKLTDDLKSRYLNNKLYLIGDVKGDIYRQTAIAVGEGVKAAMQIASCLKEIR